MSDLKRTRPIIFDHETWPDLSCFLNAVGGTPPFLIPPAPGESERLSIEAKIHTIMLQVDCKLV
jgi:hypothetical protein